MPLGLYSQNINLSLHESYVMENWPSKTQRKTIVEKNHTKIKTQGRARDNDYRRSVCTDTMKNVAYIACNIEIHAK